MKMTWNLKFPYKIKFISLVQLCFLVKEVLSLLASCILGSHPYFSWLPNFGNGLLEKLWGWGGGGHLLTEGIFSRHQIPFMNFF